MGKTNREIPVVFSCLLEFWWFFQSVCFFLWICFWLCDYVFIICFLWLKSIFSVPVRRWPHSNVSKPTASLAHQQSWTCLLTTSSSYQSSHSSYEINHDLRRATACSVPQGSKIDSNGAHLDSRIFLNLIRSACLWKSLVEFRGTLLALLFSLFLQLNSPETKGTTSNNVYICVCAYTIIYI